eukprot:gene27400-34109_t
MFIFFGACVAGTVLGVSTDISKDLALRLSSDHDDDSGLSANASQYLEPLESTCTASLGKDCLMHW